METECTFGSRPNILMIIVHDLGQHLGCLGAGVETPNIDALAQDGVIFTNYHCSAAQCSPSRGSIMTGRYPHNNGLIGLAHVGWELGAQEVTLPMYFNAAGYSTHLIGHQHEHPYAPRLGYQHLDMGKNGCRDVSEKLIDYIANRSNDPAEAPFFINSGWHEPHRPYEREGFPPDDPATVTVQPWLPDLPGIRHDTAGLNGLVRGVDECVGAVRRALDGSPLGENTLLVFTTDHGTAMPRAKGTCYDPGTKTACIMYWPEKIAAGRRCDELLTNCDFLPTMLDVAGIDCPPGLDGRSFAPLVAGKPYEPNEHIFTEMTFHDKYNPMRAVRTDRFKYIRNFGDRPLVFLPLDIYRDPAGQEMRDEYYGSRRPPEELYDLEKDPLEYTNVIDDPAYAAVAKDLRGRVSRWMHETNDPLLYGDIPPTQRQQERLDSGEADN